jgi:uncharacterized repeat protein (TIGR03847 family)
MAIVHGFDPPERFVAGTVGEPGSRTFFLQARSGPRVVSVAIEKEQVAALAERVDELLDEVMSEATTQAVVPVVTPIALIDDEPLEQPIEEEFRGGTMTLSWDPDDERVVIEVFPVGEEPDEHGEAGEMLMVRLEPAAARAFVQRTAKVVGAGRPDCPFCGQAIDPEGHLCVRANGFKRRDP